MLKPPSFPFWMQREGFRFFAFLTGVASALLTFLRLRVYPDPPGQNGYFYLKQTKVLVEQGSFYFADHSLAFLPLFVLRKITGDDLLSFQLAIGFTFALLSWGVFFFACKAVASERRSESLLFAFWVLIALFASSFFAEFSLNFFKNLLAATLLLWCAGFLLGQRPWVAFGAFCLAFLTHKSSALLGAAFLTVFLGEQVLAFFRRSDRNTVAARTGFSLLLFLGFGALFLAFFPNAKAFLEFALSTIVAPGARILWWQKLFAVNLHRGAEAMSWLLLLALLLWRARDYSSMALRVLLTVTLVFLAAVHPFQKSGDATLAYRLTLLLPVLIYPTSLMVLQSREALARWLTLAMLVVVSVPYFSPLAVGRRAVRIQMRPFSELREGVEKIPTLVAPTDYLISHHGLEFYVDYVTGIRSRSFLPEPDFKGKSFRLAFVAPSWLKNGTAYDEIAQVTLLKVGRAYILLDESDWHSLSTEHEFPSTWRNPEIRKPAHVFAE